MWKIICADINIIGIGFHYMEHYSTTCTLASGCHLKVNTINFSFCDVGEVCGDVWIHMKMFLFFFFFKYQKSLCMLSISHTNRGNYLQCLFPDGTQMHADC